MSRRSSYTKNPSPVVLAIKLIAVLIIGFLLLLTALVSIEIISDNNRDKDKTRYINWCDYDFYQKDYHGIMDTLDRFDLDGEEFDTFHEIVQGYEDYYDYLQWSATTEKMVPGSTEKAENFRQKVIQNAENCQFKRNQKQLNEWADRLK